MLKTENTFLFVPNIIGKNITKFSNNIFILFLNHVYILFINII